MSVTRRTHIFVYISIFSVFNSYNINNNKKLYFRRDKIYIYFFFLVNLPTNN